MRTVIGVILGIIVGGAVCGFGPCIGIDLMFRQERAEQGNLEVFALSMLALLGGGIIGAAIGAVVGGVCGARLDRRAEAAERDYGRGDWCL
jgi:hypothetical protein